MRRKFRSFFLSSMTSSRSRLYFVSVRMGVIIENTEPIRSPGRLPCASIKRSMSSGLRLRVHRLMNPKPWRSSSASGIAVEVDGRNREDEVLHRLGVEGGVAGGEDPA